MRALAASIFTASILSSSFAFATPSQKPILLTPSTDPCAATWEELLWLREDIYPRLAKDIPRILEKEWAYDVSTQDLYHVHVYVEGTYAQPPITNVRGRLKKHVGFLYHSKERLNIHEKRNIFIGPGERFEALDDIARDIDSTGGERIDWETGEPLSTPIAPSQALETPGIHLIQVQFATSEEGLARTFFGSQDHSTVQHVGAYWFGTYLKTEYRCAKNSAR